MDGSSCCRNKLKTLKLLATQRIATTERVMEHHSNEGKNINPPIIEIERGINLYLRLGAVGKLKSSRDISKRFTAFRDTLNQSGCYKVWYSESIFMW